jgi:hypothetical protein
MPSAEERTTPLELPAPGETTNSAEERRTPLELSAPGETANSAEERRTPLDVSVPEQAPPSDPSPPAPLPALAVAEIRFTCPAAMLALIERAKDALAHSQPEGRLADIFAAALKALLAAKTPKAPTRVVPQRPSAPRHIPAAVERQVRERDGNRCAFASEDGRRCNPTHALEFDHIIPFALGGRSDDVDNIRQLAGSTIYGAPRRLLDRFEAGSAGRVRQGASRHHAIGRKRRATLATQAKEGARNPARHR